MKEITIETPVPSVNGMYRGRRFLTQKGREDKETIQWEIKSQIEGKPKKGEVILSIDFFFGNKRKNDIDNRLKALLDCCTGVLYEDDSQVTEIHVFKNYDKENPRTEVTIL